MRQEAVARQERVHLPGSAKKKLAVLLGVLMLTFGFLKVLIPTVDGWFHAQIQGSHLPHSAILIGKIAEITTGLLFLSPWFLRLRLKWQGRILLIASASLVVEMLVATYVHLQPGVPAEVLPLGVKPPVIPLFVLVLAAIVAIRAWKDSQPTLGQE